MAEIHEGGCLCGAVRWRASGAPKNVNHCHCEMCRRGSGAVVVTWAAFATADFIFTKGAPVWRQSSAIARRSFCGSCGSALNWQSLTDSNGIDVTVGTSDRPEALAPREHLWTDAAVSWFHIQDNLPRHRRQRAT
jgi:hypothetical protein